MDEATKIVIQIILFLISIGTVVWRFSSVTATMKEQIKSLFLKFERKDEVDREQNSELRRLGDKTSNVITSVEVIRERSKHVEEAIGRVEDKIDKLSYVLTSPTDKKQ